MNMAQDLASLPAYETTHRIRQGNLKVTELCDATLAKAKARSDIGAWTYLDKDLVHDQAERLDRVPKDERISPLFGAIVGIKDIIHTKG
jgi:Asp-tRNA(Asn)/Glu-tRNA(Gln) amidotransferase A subunit family amidase